MLESQTDESGHPMPHGHRGDQADHDDQAIPWIEPREAPPLRVDWAPLAHLVTHLGGVPMALWAQALPGGPVLLGACGLPADQQAGALALCTHIAADTALNGCLLDADVHPVSEPHTLAGLQPHIRFCLVLPVPSSSETNPTWLALLDTTPRSPEALADRLPGLQAMAAHAGHLQDLARQQQRSAHLTQGREERLGKALHESESRLNLRLLQRTRRAVGVDVGAVTRRSGRVRSIIDVGLDPRLSAAAIRGRGSTTNSGCTIRQQGRFNIGLERLHLALHLECHFRAASGLVHSFLRAGDARHGVGDLPVVVNAGRGVGRVGRRLVSLEYGIR